MKTNISPDTVDFAAVVMHTGKLVSVGQILKLPPWQQKWQNSGQNLIKTVAIANNTILMNFSQTGRVV